MTWNAPIIFCVIVDELAMLAKRFVPRLQGTMKSQILFVRAEPSPQCPPLGSVKPDLEAQNDGESSSDDDLDDEKGQQLFDFTFKQYFHTKGKTLVTLSGIMHVPKSVLAPRRVNVFDGFDFPDYIWTFYLRILRKVMF